LCTAYLLHNLKQIFSLVLKVRQIYCHESHFSERLTKLAISFITSVGLSVIKQELGSQ